MDEQSTLDGFSATPEPEGSETHGLRSDVRAYDRMPEDAEPTNTLSCPWCCTPPEKFRKREVAGRTIIGCSNCSAVIPHEAEWYLNGDKIIL